MNENFSVEEKNYFVNGGKINIDMLNRVSNGAVDSINNINKLLYTPGVLFLPTTISNNFLIEDAGITNGIQYIDVGRVGNSADASFGGVAVDIDGKFIVINKNEAYVGWNDDSLNYNINTLSWKSPVRADDPNLATTDGMGPTGKYSRNSGNYNIPLTFIDGLTDGQNTNYVYIKYVQVVEQTSASTQTTTDGLNTYDSEVMYKGGYAIRVVNPNDPSNTDISASNFDVVLKEMGYIKIGEVYKNGASIQISTLGTNIPTPATTQYAYLNGSIVGAPFLGYVGGIEYPTTAGNYIDLYTHINAVGTGSVNTNNPHGLSAQDLGISVNNSNVNVVTSIIANGASTYNLDTPLKDLTSDPNYDTMLIDATNGGIQDVTVRLPEANINNTSLRYTIKRIDSNASATVSISSIVNGSNNYIENDTTLEDDTYSVHELGVLGSTNSCVTVCVGLNASNNYNWYII